MLHLATEKRRKQRVACCIKSRSYTQWRTARDEAPAGKFNTIQCKHYCKTRDRTGASTEEQFDFEEQWAPMRMETTRTERGVV